MKRYALISLVLLASCAMLPRNAPDEPGEMERQEPKTESGTQHAEKPKPKTVSRPHGTAEKPKAVLPPPPQCKEPETEDRRKVMLIKLDCLLKSGE